MTESDSDESLSNSGDYSTSVTLGYASKEPTSDDFSQLGGSPSWLDPSAPASATAASCRSCKSIMPLLLQLNADLPERFSGHERRLYIWGCRNRQCRRKDGAVRAWRCTRPNPETESNGEHVEIKQGGPKIDLGASLFGATTTIGSSPTSTNPFASAPAPASSLAAKPAQKPQPDLSATFAEKARISTPPPHMDQSQEPPYPTDPSLQPQPYPTYHIDAEAEYLAPTSSSSNGAESSQYKAFLDQAENAEPTSGDSAEDKQLYEDSHDKTFQHFADTIAQNPEQVLRYDYGGQPLLYSRNDKIGRLMHRQAQDTNTKVQLGGSIMAIPRCPCCAAHRVFEVQLTPQTITELEAEEDAVKMLTEGLEWGTVIVAVCDRDCYGRDGNASWREEWVGVQWEEVVKRDGESRSKGKGKGKS